MRCPQHHLKTHYFTCNLIAFLWKNIERTQKTLGDPSIVEENKHRWPYRCGQQNIPKNLYPETKKMQKASPYRDIGGAGGGTEAAALCAHEPRDPRAHLHIIYLFIYLFSYSFNYLSIYSMIIFIHFFIYINCVLCIGMKSSWTSIFQPRIGLSNDQSCLAYMSG